LPQLPKPDQVLLQSMTKAQTLVKEAQSVRSDKQAFALTLWKAAAESEYAAFRIAVALGYEDYQSPDIDEDPQGDQLEVAEELLKEAEKSLSQKPQQSYASVRKTVAILRKMYGAEEKGAKEDVPEPVDSPEQ